MAELGQRLTSRKFLIAVAAIAYAIVSELLGTITPAEAIDTIRAAGLAYIAAEGLADVVGRIPSSKDPRDTSPAAARGGSAAEP